MADVTNTRPHLGIKAEKMDTEPSVYWGAWMDGYRVGDEGPRGIGGWVVRAQWPRRGLEGIRSHETFFGYMSVLVGAGVTVGRERLYPAATSGR